MGVPIVYFKGHAQIQRGDRGLDPPPPPKKLQKCRVIKQYRSGSPENLQGYQAGIQCWVIIDTPAKRHQLNKKIVVKVGPPLTELSGSAHEGHQVVFSKLWCISVREGCFNLSKRCTRVTTYVIALHVVRRHL